MAISELQPRQGKVNVVSEIVEKGEPRAIEKENFSGKVCDAKIKDSSGEIKLTLWNEQVDKFNVGDIIKVENGYVNEWQGELQLSSGKFGNIELVEKSTKEPTAEQSETTDEKTEEQLIEKEGEKTDSGEHILTEDEKTESELLSEEKEKDDHGEKILTPDEQVEEEIIE